MNGKPTAVVLFSGGLDSLLAAKILGEQGVNIFCLHLYSPFFGSPRKVKYWRAVYGLDVIARDVGTEFCAMLAAGPPAGTGKNLNPCVDCKILLYRYAARFMKETGADFIASGEVLGQRPMSQRRDALNRIHNAAGVAGLALRPLSALLLEPTEPEKNGLVDRSRLLDISGRSRTAQLVLAEKYGVTDIPSPAGGCALTQTERARRYWSVLRKYILNKSGGAPQPEDYELAGVGRQFFNSAGLWLTVGRNRRDNEYLRSFLRESDVLVRLKDFPGPAALARDGVFWPDADLAEAGAIVASYSPEAAESGFQARVRLISSGNDREINVKPARENPRWGLPPWEKVREEMTDLRPLWYGTSG